MGQNRFEVATTNNDYQRKSVDAGRVGAAVEHLVAASCILATNGELNVMTSLVDDEGVALVFNRRGHPETLAVQVKSRSSDTSTMARGRFLATVRAQTFSPRSDLLMLFVVVDRPTAVLRTTWLVPSREFDELAITMGSGDRRMSASAKPGSKDKWTPYRMGFPELSPAILAALRNLRA
jgi:hypothetical protein